MIGVVWFRPRVVSSIRVPRFSIEETVVDVEVRPFRMVIDSVKRSFREVAIAAR